MTHHHLDVASVLTLVCSGGSGRRVRQRRSKAWDDTPEGVDDGTQGWCERGRPGLCRLALASVFLPELSLLRTRGLDGCSCQVRMALSICRRVESLDAKGSG